MEFLWKEDCLLLVENNETIGKLFFATKDKVLYIQKIIVDEKYRGKGYAFSILNEAIEEAKKKGYSIIPHCSYAKAYFEKHPEDKRAEVIKE